MEEKQTKVKIFTYICKKCNKRFESMNENQANNNGRVHEINCKNK